MRVYIIYILINFTAVNCKTMIIRYRNDKNLLSESLTSNNTNKTPFSESMILISMAEISKGEAIQPSPLRFLILWLCDYQNFYVKKSFGSRSIFKNLRFIKLIAKLVQLIRSGGGIGGMHYTFCISQHYRRLSQPH